MALLHVSPYDSARRVYQDGDRVLKVRFGPPTPGAAGRAQSSMADEFDLLRKCQGIRGVPQALEVWQNDRCECLVMEHIRGQTLEESQARIGALAIALIQLTLVVSRLAWRGVSHNDILPQNIILSQRGEVYLIDFDQATEERFVGAWLKGVLGVKSSSGKGYGSVITSAKRLVRAKIGYDATERVQQAARRHVIASRHPLPRLPSTASAEMKDMRRAWKLARLSAASSPEAALAYYAVDFEGFELPGERAWADRWAYLRSAVSFEGKRVIELGCNVGLLSIHAVKEGGAAAAKGADVDPLILKAARLAARAYRVDVSFDLVDLDAPAAWETGLTAFKPDLVTALNVMNWVTDKERLARFLGNFREVLYEGHDPFDMECERLRIGGLTHFELVATSERNRPVMYCTGPGRGRG